MIIEYVWKKRIFTDPLLPLRMWRRVVRSGEPRRRLSHWSTRSLHWRRREARIGGDVGSHVKYAYAAAYDDWREEKKNFRHACYTDGGGKARISGDVGSHVKYANAAAYDDWREEKKNSSHLLQAFRRPSHYTVYLTLGCEVWLVLLGLYKRKLVCSVWKNLLANTFLSQCLR